MFMSVKSLKFFRTAILEPLQSHFAKIAHKVAKSKYFFNIENELVSLINSFSNDIKFVGISLVLQKLSVEVRLAPSPSLILQKCV